MTPVSRFPLLVLVLLGALLSGCAATGPQMAAPAQLTAPEPLADTSGQYMNPYTEDGVLAAWVDKAINAKMGAQAGSMIGAYAGQKALENIPFIGGMLGQAAGESLGREIAIRSAGGMEYIVDNSDSSFATVDDLALNLYVNHSDHKHYQDALSATMEIYPELKTRYYAAIMAASQNAAN